MATAEIREVAVFKVIPKRPIIAKFKRIGKILGIKLIRPIDKDLKTRIIIKPMVIPAYNRLFI